MGNIYIAHDGNISIIIKGNREKMCDCCEKDLKDYNDQMFCFEGDENFYLCYECVDRANKLRKANEHYTL